MSQWKDPNGNLSGADRTLGSDDPDLAQQASAVLGSLKLDEDDSPGFPNNSSINSEHAAANNNNDDMLRAADARHSLQSSQRE